MSSTASTSFASTSANATDIEAQRTSAQINALTPAVTHATWTAPEVRVMDPMDDHFGYTFSSSRTHESRHDRRESIADVPPPYAEESAIPLPEYALHAPEPVTLAMFLHGYLPTFSYHSIPTFLDLGAFILLSPLREPPSTSDSTPAWMPEKTEDERKQIIATLREVELKWAKRCLCAFIIFALLAVGGALAAWGLLRH
ncbi:hypothetical protein BDZ97DRAFT_1809296 [Flammula alnicola]|nr:hypothetical protein BDZ97DRAFT_1809296 [Flammula alnicola]